MIIPRRMLRVCSARNDKIRPFDIYKRCTKLKVNRPCYWLARFGTRFLHVERPYGEEAGKEQKENPAGCAGEGI